MIAHYKKLNYPKISIVTPSYNQGQYLEETILSVLEQGYPNLEYVIIDGGSNDNSVDIIKKYEKHLTYWVSEKDKGLYDAIQKGFEKTSGEIMAWINSDDLYHKKSFFVVSEIFSAFQQVEWIHGLPTQFDEQGRIVSVSSFRKWSKYDYLLMDYEWIQQESCFWKRSLWENSGGSMDVSLKYAGDFALWLKFFNHASLYCLNTILGGFRGRSKNQFSIERLNDYRVEAGELLKIRRSNLSPDEKKNYNRMVFYRKFLRKFPVISELYNLKYIRPIYPSSILFNRSLQKFEMTDSQGFYHILKSYTAGKNKKVM